LGSRYVLTREVRKAIAKKINTANTQNEELVATCMKSAKRTPGPDVLLLTMRMNSNDTNIRKKRTITEIVPAVRLFIANMAAILSKIQALDAKKAFQR
jgi:signal-transduction protein with cAMP-binding, CBS, and nucleotidyltransferase domain